MTQYFNKILGTLLLFSSLQTISKVVELWICASHVFVHFGLHHYTKSFFSTRYKQPLGLMIVGSLDVVAGEPLLLLPRRFKQNQAYIIIGIIVGDSNDGYASMITYMLFYIAMNLGSFARIVLFGLHTGTDNIRDYPCLLSLGGLPPLAGFFRKLHLLWCGWQAGLYFLVSIGLLMSILSIYYYLKIIKLLMTGRNQEITLTREGICSITSIQPSNVILAVFCFNFKVVLPLIPQRLVAVKREKH
ncbi:unnamed protein product [Spirodela intermedia]|uniref:NADH:quinone oxidoreductase/Mrp antiporter transmembrane domain-containing protein n=1 Tax=Spirodela intermedia TaxID=51605 RepID=A0A7I8LHP6_SPIIN|nr:unnamed protein product [Spirodela intermedia]